MNLQAFEPTPPLKGYIDRMWVFESDCGLPLDDMRMLVPDGRLLLLIPFENGVTGKMGGRDYLVRERDISLVGITDQPAVIDAQFPEALGIIGVDFNPMGAYRFFHWSLRDIKNEVASLSDVMGRTAQEIRRRLDDCITISDKVKLVQQFLYQLLSKRDTDSIFEYCIQRIHSTKGALTINQLGKETGYSVRWLHRKFEENLGMGPKNYARIARFQHYYQTLLTDADGVLRHKEFYTHYFDESHFIREFKQFTGMPPAKLEKAINRFGRLFQ